MKPPRFIINWVHNHYLFLEICGYARGWEDGYEYKKKNGNKYDHPKYHVDMNKSDTFTKIKKVFRLYILPYGKNREE